MNSRFKELKISNYKNKLAHKYSFLKIRKLFHGCEDKRNTDFSKKAINSENVKTKEFGIYDIQKNIYVDVLYEYKKALEYFKEELKMFRSDEDVIFDVEYNQEYFRIQCPAAEFVIHFNEIDDFKESIIIYNEALTKMVAIIRMEYSFDVLSYCAS